MDTLSTVPTAALILEIFWLWGRMEKALDRRYLARYQPVPIPSKCIYTPDQVSVIVCTVDTLLARCLRSWLANKPLELLIVTISEHKNQILSVVANASLSDADFAKVKVIESPTKGKRPQLAVGIRNAKGAIIASTDDHISWSPEFLKGMLPCFENETVGAVGPTISAVISKDRQDSNIITPWEVAATRVAWNRNPQLKATYAAARWCWVLAGGTAVFRAFILKDPMFILGYTNDTWMGKKMEAGEDNFVSRWLQSHGWIIAIQAMPETEVYRTVKTSPDFFKQMFRWERSTIRTHIRTVVDIPQIYSSLFVARKTWGRLLRPALTTCHLFAWVFALLSGGWSCVVVLLLVVWYILEAYPSYQEFFAEHPYMRRYWWAAVSQDLFYVVQDYVCWLTLDDIRWEARKVSAENQHKRE
ncbi:glycosyltransferase family 2 protein [Stipitochalara longipes BDJ]|nr:glycosyltransferase family 2 protein [Stipitochalara longipes BDJ]